MKINQIQIDGFGKWQNQAFDLDDHLTIFWGNNEAGKSTLARFIVSMLFGFANGHQPYEQYLPKKSGIVYGGALTVTVNGQQYTLHRKAGKNGGILTILDQTGQPMPVAWLSQQLGPIDQQEFESLYSFDERQLNQIFTLTKTDLQAQLQKLGAVNSQQWLTLVTQFEQQADDLYKARGRNPVINQKLKQYHALIAEIRQAETQYDRYQALLTEIKTKQTRGNQLKHILASSKAQVTQAQDLVRLWPVYEKQRQTQHTEPQISTITMSDVTTVQTIRAQESELKRQQQQAQQQLTTLESEDTASTQQTFYRQYAQQLAEIVDRGKILQRELDQQSQLTEQLTACHRRQDQLKARYGNQVLPAPLSVELETTLRQLLSHSMPDSASRQARTATQTPRQLPWSLVVIVIIGLLLLVIGGHWLLRGIGLVMVIACGWSGWRQWQAPTERRSDASTVNPELQAFGTAHGFNSFPPTQWLQVQTDAQRSQELTQQVETVSTRLAQLETLTVQYRQSVQALGAFIDVSQPIAPLIRQVYEFVTTQQSAGTRWQQTQQQRQLLASQVMDLRQQRDQLAAAKTKLYTRYQVHSDEQFDRHYERALESTVDQERAQVWQRQLTAEQLTAFRQAGSLERLQAQVTTLQQDVETNQQDFDRTQQQLTKLQFELTQIAENGTLTVLRQRQADMETEIGDLVTEWLSQKLAANWIDQALQLASNDRFPQIIAKAQKYFEILTNHHYTKINLVTSQLIVTDRDGESFEVGELSLGTAEQLYLSLKLGFTTVMNVHSELPLIIDDGFVNFDEDRKRQVLELLHQLSTTQQIIYLTADPALQKTSIGTVINLNLK